jgi:2'-5' RNA ligase
MSTMRLFIAAALPGAVKNELTAALKIITHANPHVRGVGPAGMHLTLKFLGETATEQIGGIRRAMEAAVAVVSGPIHLVCAGAGGFPNLDRPRVLWAGLSGDTATLAAMQRALDRELEKLGFAREERAFHPHVTLGRLKEPKMLGALHKAWPRVERLAFGEFDVDALTLYRSELQPGGAVYTPIERTPLPGTGVGGAPQPAQPAPQRAT